MEEEHIYEDPDLEFSKTVTKQSNPIKPVGKTTIRGEKKVDKKEKRGLNIFKNLKKKDKQISLAVQEHSEVSSGKSLGKGFDDGSASRGILSDNSSPNYYIKDGRWVTSSAPNKVDTPQVIQHSAQSSLPIMMDEEDMTLRDSSLTPPPLPNREYLLDTTFLADLEGSTTVTATANPCATPLSEDENNMPLPESYYEDTETTIREETEDVDGYVNVSRDVEDEDESDEYIEADVHPIKETEYINTVRRSGNESDDSDDYIQTDVYLG